MLSKKIIRASAFVLALSLTMLSITRVSDLRKSSASVIKNYNGLGASSSLPKVVYNGEEMYTAKAAYYDYYSDSQVGTSATPGAITDAKDISKNTFGKFNKRLMGAMKYNNQIESPAKYPLYQGRLAGTYTDNPLWDLNNETVSAASNYWRAANHHQGLQAVATQGLVDSKLTYDSAGESYITQSNPANGKKANLPYFDKNFLTTTKHEGSELSLGGVKDNFAFPFRTEVDSGTVYYEFDSSIDTVRFNSSNQLDYKGKNNTSEQVGDGDTTPLPGLFPENTPADTGSNSLNFGYGLKLEIPFTMTRDGKINGKDMVFEFRGDDDVWVFIDGYLALDLGGAHPKLNGNINFANGKATVEAAKNNTVAFSSRNLNNLKDETFTNNALGIINQPTMYKNYITEFSDELKKSLKDTDKVHTLTMFYMERGMYASNMKIKFNLPEPSRLDVANEINFDNVGETFLEETKNVAKNDEFVYDVVDKTINKKAQIDMKDKESVTFLNEFDDKDKLLVQESSLKSPTRKLTELYSTSWLLKDTSKEIAKDSGLVVKDSRTPEKYILFANSDNAGIPVLTAKYTNKPLVGKFVVGCYVSDKYKELHSEYKNDEFEYYISYKNVFGGGSSEQPYVGKYIVTKQDGTTTEMTTSDGTAKLKPDEKLTIKNIPVLTELSVKTNVTDTCVIKKVKTTSQFKYDPDNKTATGMIKVAGNVVEFTMGDKAETEVKEEENLTKEEIKDITGEDVDVQTPSEKLEDPSKDGDELDDAVATGDSTDLITWTVIMIISLLLTFGSAISMVRKKA